MAIKLEQYVTARDGFLNFVHGAEDIVVPPKIESVVFETHRPIDRPEHAHMFPDKGGTHVPHVFRYKSGFRNPHPLANNTKP